VKLRAHVLSTMKCLQQCSKVTAEL